MKFCLSFFRFILISFFCVLSFSSQGLRPDFVFDSQGNEIDFSQIDFSNLKSGSALLICENHGFVSHHDNQNLLLWALKKQIPRLSVGFEFLNFPDQMAVDTYLTGEMTETQFKEKYWQGGNWLLYKPQIEFSRLSSGKTVALNVPREITSAIYRGGFESLTPQQRALLPENFQIGNEKYFERFKEAVGGHLDPEKLKNAFAAQSAWDEAMASTAAKFLKNNPDQVLAIIVGDFHCTYGGGLPDRLRARGVSQLMTISQFLFPENQKDKLGPQVTPHPSYGPRADYTIASPAQLKQENFKLQNSEPFSLDFLRGLLN